MIGLFVAFAGGVLVVAPLRAPIPRTTLAQGSDVFGPIPQILAGVASGAGAMIVVAGAVWSALRLAAARRRSEAPPASGRLVLSNALIAAGTLVAGASGILNSVLDAMTAFALTLVAGISVIFAGFLVATAAPHRPEAMPASIRRLGPREIPAQELARRASRD